MLFCELNLTSDQTISSSGMLLQILGQLLKSVFLLFSFQRLTTERLAQRQDKTKRFKQTS